ncbi:hypothetical protein BD779DRAFT_1530425 [Infundibulicybe gibba]|nr:hypothetical protein BD779DRAFT_1530425 [Infundibulicybe gibba]
MSYIIFGRAIKNEYLALGVLTTAIGGAVLSMRGGKTDSAPRAGQSVQQVKEAIPINASSSEEERFIQNFIAEAEKAEAKH